MISILRLSLFCIQIFARPSPDKSALYKQYPQLIDPIIREKNECVMAFNRYLTSVYSHEYQTMWQASLKYMTDMGNKEECASVEDSEGNVIS